MQRLRLRFGRGSTVRFISHLDTMRCWERVFRRAGVPLEYTQGFTPHPKLAVAAPLAVGFTGAAELMDIWLRKWTPPEAVLMMLRPELPQGFELSEVWEVPLRAPSLQAIICSARYRCVAWCDDGLSAARAAAQAFLASESVMYEYRRKDEVRSQDIRPLVRDVVVGPGAGGACEIELDVRLGQEGSVRPEHVLAVLGFAGPAESIERVSLSWES